MADSGGGSDWEVVSLTASTYAAAPGPGPIPPIHDDDAAEKTESPLLLVPNPAAPNSHFFMSQHFNLPPLFGTTHLLENNKGGQELEESGPAAMAHLIIPCPGNHGESNGLEVEGGGGGEEPQRTTKPRSPAEDHIPAAAAADATDDTATVGSADALPALPVPVAGGVAAARPPCNAGQAQAWWEKTFSFPRQDGNGNGGTQPLLAFRFVFVAGKLQLQEDHLSGPVTESGGVHSQTQKISCVVTEPLAQVKGSMLGGGSPVAQQAA